MKTIYKIITLILVPFLVFGNTNALEYSKGTNVTIPFDGYLLTEIYTDFLIEKYNQNKSLNTKLSNREELINILELKVDNYQSQILIYDNINKKNLELMKYYEIEKDTKIGKGIWIALSFVGGVITGGLIMYSAYNIAK